MPENENKKTEAPKKTETKAPKAKKNPKALIEKNGKYYGNVDAEFQYPLNDLLDVKKSAWHMKQGLTIKDRAKDHENVYLVRQCQQDVFDGQVMDVPSTVSIQCYDINTWDEKMLIPTEKGEVSDYQKRLGLKMIVLHDPTK